MAVNGAMVGFIPRLRVTPMRIGPGLSSPLVRRHGPRIGLSLQWAITRYFAAGHGHDGVGTGGVP